ncbi:MAG: helix-turn-helix transcriptional regulator [Rubrobacter sp.]|nr:helix-turn-helix transcriptional regulator [Rubrobacter sp.]
MIPDRGSLNIQRRRLGFRLEEARKAKGMTLSEAGRLLGKPHTWVWKIEAGERRVDAVELWHICRAYDLDFEGFLREVVDG